MSTNPRRVTVYFDPALHRALRVKAAETERALLEAQESRYQAGLQLSDSKLRGLDHEAHDAGASQARLSAGDAGT